MKTFLISLLCVISFNLAAQGIFGVKKGSYLGSEFGFITSGIRKEDFVAKNIAPKLILYAGKKVNDFLSIQFGYSGFYFNTIANNDKRRYQYFNLVLEQSLFRLNLLQKKNIYQNIALQFGGGAFFNKYYGSQNFCGELGIVIEQNLAEKLRFCLRTSSIMGWDLYQGDADILNGLTIGIKKIL